MDDFEHGVRSSEPPTGGHPQPGRLKYYFRALSSEIITIFQSYSVISHIRLVLSQFTGLLCGIAKNVNDVTRKGMGLHLREQLE